MLKNYLTVALRSLGRQKGFAAINIIGLAAGLAVCLLIVLLPLRQWHMDRFHDQADRIHRVTADPPPAFGSHATYGFATTPAPLGPLMRQTHTGVEAVVRMRQTGANLLRGERRLALDREEGISSRRLYAEPSFFAVFDGFRLARGGAEDALRQPFSVVLTPGAAARLFDEEDPVGQTVHLTGTGDLTVTGVLAEPAGPSHLQFDALLSFSTLQSTAPASLEDWSNIYAYATYVLLEEGTAPERVEAQLAQSATRLQSSNPDFDPQADFEANPLPLQPLLDIAFDNRKANAIGRVLLPPFVLWMLGGLAFVIMLAAGFNYANLSVARSLVRAREVGVRRTVGATRTQVAGQFLGEAVLTSLLALGAALVLLLALIPAFNGLRVIQITGLHVSLATLRDAPVLLLFVAISAAVGLFAGLYPAVVLSRFRPAEVLRGGASGAVGRSRFWLRKALTGSQFVLSLVFLVTGVLAYQQARFMAERDLGFATEDLVTVDLASADYETFRTEAQALAGVERVAGTSLLPADGSQRTKTARLAGSDQEKSLPVYAVDHAFLEALDLAFVGGARPSEAAFAAGRGLVVNAAAARALGLGTPTEAQGQQVEIDSSAYRVVGVVEAFRHEPSLSASEAEAPVLLYAGAPADFAYALVHIAPGAAARVTERLAAAWPQMGAETPFRARLYADVLYEQHALLYAEGARVVGLAALLAVLISCLGLLGMAAYQVEARRKEVAVRKAMGASAWDVGALLSKGFLRLVAAAVVVGLPLAWLLNALWLQQIAHRIAVRPLTLAGCAALLFLLALATVGTQAARTARIHPATMLRDE